MRRYFIVFFIGNSLGQIKRQGNCGYITDGNSYVNCGKVTDFINQEFDLKQSIITNIIELNDKDYADFMRKNP